MAAAHVSGIVALLLEHDAKLNWSEVRVILSSSARKPDRSIGREAVGAGIVDAAGALGERDKGETGDHQPLGPAVSGGR